MKPIINHRFKVNYIKPTKPFEWKETSSIVGYTSYKERIVPQIEDVAFQLYHDKHTRQAVIVVNEMENHMSCLINYQFQIVDDTLYVTANYRSMCKKWGLPNDIDLVCYVIFMLKNTSIFRMLYSNLKTDITFNVGNFHERLDISK